MGTQCRGQRAAWPLPCAAASTMFTHGMPSHGDGWKHVAKSLAEDTLALVWHGSDLRFVGATRCWRPPVQRDNSR